MKRYQHTNQNGRYTLTLSDTGKVDGYGKVIVKYSLRKAGENRPIFAGDDLHVSPMHTPESPESAEALLGFLLLREGDTDPELFCTERNGQSYDYTPRQWEFSRNEAESLYIWQEELNPAEHPEG